MPKFKVLWSMRGRYEVEAKDEDEAREKFHAAAIGAPEDGDCDG